MKEKHFEGRNKTKKKLQVKLLFVISEKNSEILKIQTFSLGWYYQNLKLLLLKLCNYYYSIIAFSIYFVPIRMGLFRATLYTYPILIELGIIKAYLEKIWHQLFLLEINNFRYLKKLWWNFFWYIVRDSFDYSWVFKVCLDKHECNFDDFSEIGYSRSLWNNCIFKRSLWCHNIGSWRHL